MIGTDERAQLRRVEQDLLRRYGDRLPREVICAEVEQAKQEFAAAKVRTFVPVLVQRRVQDALRRSA